MKITSNKILCKISLLVGSMGFPLLSLADQVATQAQVDAVAHQIQDVSHHGFALLATFFIVASMVWYLVDLILFCVRKAKKSDRKTRIRGATTLLILAIVSALIQMIFIH